MEIVDLSQEIFQGMPVFPGHQPTVVFPVTKIKEIGENKRSFAVNTLLFSEHAGTHTDSFTHTNTSEDALSIEKLSLDKFIGEAICLDVSHVPDSELIYVKDLEKPLNDANLSIPDNGIVLLYTGAYVRHFPKPIYNQKNPGLSREAAQWLAERGIKNVGIDAVSIDASPNKGDEWKPAHNVCEETGMLNTENLGDLRPVAGKAFYYIGFPLKVRNGTAGPTRAVAILDKKFI
ncbi:cyclase family protein [Bacillus canaveralius]|uniref:cyclase family protein n=1 Tax=Bacillus canaveralius TaxID=1403243 RepID=UPI00163B0348|nr:cyclase family protein [Bacillus canaveralius]